MTSVNARHIWDVTNTNIFVRWVDTIESTETPIVNAECVVSDLTGDPEHYNLRLMLDLPEHIPVAHDNGVRDFTIYRVSDAETTPVMTGSAMVAPQLKSIDTEDFSSVASAKVAEVIEDSLPMFVAGQSGSQNRDDMISYASDLMESNSKQEFSTLVNSMLPEAVVQHMFEAGNITFAFDPKEYDGEQFSPESVGPMLREMSLNLNAYAAHHAGENVRKLGHEAAAILADHAIENAPTRKM